MEDKLKGDHLASFKNKIKKHLHDDKHLIKYYEQASPSKVSNEPKREKVIVEYGESLHKTLGHKRKPHDIDKPLLKKKKLDLVSKDSTVSTKSKINNKSESPSKTSLKETLKKKSEPSFTLKHKHISKKTDIEPTNSYKKIEQSKENIKSVLKETDDKQKIKNIKFNSKNLGASKSLISGNVDSQIKGKALKTKNKDDRTEIGANIRNCKSLSELQLSKKSLNKQKVQKSILKKGKTVRFKENDNEVKTKSIGRKSTPMLKSISNLTTKKWQKVTNKTDLPWNVGTVSVKKKLKFDNDSDESLDSELKALIYGHCSSSSKSTVTSNSEMYGYDLSDTSDSDIELNIPIKVGKLEKEPKLNVSTKNLRKISAKKKIEPSLNDLIKEVNNAVKTVEDTSTITCGKKRNRMKGEKTIKRRSLDKIERVARAILEDDVLSNNYNDFDEEMCPFRKICGFVPTSNEDHKNFMQDYYKKCFSLNESFNSISTSYDNSHEFESTVAFSNIKSVENLQTEQEERATNCSKLNKQENNLVSKEDVPSSIGESESECTNYLEELRHILFHEEETNLNVQYIDADNGQIIILKQNKIYFHGLLILILLKGNLEINGYSLKRDKEYELYSPRGSSYLYIKNTTNTLKSSEHPSVLGNKLYCLGIPYKQSYVISSKVDNTEAVFYCKKLESNKIDFIEKHISQQLFPQNDLRFVFSENPTENDWNVVNVHASWSQILEEENKNWLKVFGMEYFPKILLCGGKSVGKSTLLRFYCNKLLNNYQKVLIIDLDPGQPEFTMPGCISATIVTEPLFGPNYTHLKNPERCIFVQSINIASNPQHYIEAVETLIELCSNLEKMPILVNFMGFTRGIGLNLLSSVIAIVNPIKVVEIFSQRASKNLPAVPELQVVSEYKKMFTDKFVPDPYQLHRIPSMTDENKGWELEPRQVREMICLAYLSQALPEDVLSLTHEKVDLYECNLRDISLVEKTEKISPAEVLAQLVALCCKVQKKEHLYKCFGWGIVRGIDASKNTLYLTTPVNMSENEEVDHLVLGSVALPPSLYMTEDGNHGLIPYVQIGSLTGFTQMSKRSIISNRKNEFNNESKKSI